MAKPFDLWTRFCAAVQGALNESLEDDLVAAWASSPSRTAFYRELLRDVAEKMGLNVRREALHVDFTFEDEEKNGEPVPVVFIETENNAFRAHEEIRKLAALTAPLKILIGVVEWDETPDVWEKGSRRKELLSQWQTIIAHYDANWPRSGLTGIIIGERRPDNRLCFHTCALTSNGELISTVGRDGRPEIHGCIFSKELNWGKTADFD